MMPYGTYSDMPMVIVFDLDDTLYKECDYQISGFQAVATYISSINCIQNRDVLELLQNAATNGEDAFQKVIDYYGLAVKKDSLKHIYRNHYPKILLDHETIKVLDTLKQKQISMGVITDGRYISQMNKIKALGLTNYFQKQAILISEVTGYQKPCIEPFEHIQQIIPDSHYCYVGDNPDKDFYAPNKLGWETVCLLDNGRNIHAQNFDKAEEWLPKKYVSSLNELLINKFISL